MKIAYDSHSILETKADLAIFCVFKEFAKAPLFKTLDRKTNGRSAQIAQEEDFSGKAGQSILVDTHGLLPANRIVLLGLGDKAMFHARDRRNVAARALRIAKNHGAKSVALEVPRDRDVGPAIQRAVEGLVLGEYRFDKYLNKESKPGVSSVSLHVAGKSDAKRTKQAKDGIARGQTIASAICRARDFVNEPAGFMTPKQLAKEAKDIGKHKALSVRVYSAAECRKMKMNMFLSVGQGSAQESQLIHITYKPKRKPKRRIALIGKGVTFDSGGYSLKPSSAMEDMKIDMAGSATVISAMSAIAELAPPVEVHAVAACCENLVSGNAYKLGDVLTAMDGTTVEINNTDAEGRLTLGDALIFTRTKIKPDEIVDFATLTGACMVALGPTTAGVMSTNNAMAKRWLEAAQKAGESMWRLPLTRELKSQLKSNIADMKNTGERYGGAITAGLFLKHFAGDTPWVHVDLAGPASSSKTAGAISRGGTGFAVATIAEFVCNA